MVASSGCRRMEGTAAACACSFVWRLKGALRMGTVLAQGPPPPLALLVQHLTANSTAAAGLRCGCLSRPQCEGAHPGLEPGPVGEPSAAKVLGGGVWCCTLGWSSWCSSCSRRAAYWSLPRLHDVPMFTGLCAASPL